MAADYEIYKIIIGKNSYRQYRALLLNKIYNIKVSVFQAFVITKDTNGNPIDSSNFSSITKAARARNEIENLVL